MSEFLPRFLDAFTSFGVIGYFMLSLGSSFVLIPRPLLCVLGGYLLGLWAIPVGIAGIALGSALALLVTRYLLRERVGRMLASRPLVSAAMRAVDGERWRLILLLRLCSPIPGCLVNYFFGLTGIGVLSFTTASIVGVAPQVGLFVYFGIAGQALSGSGPMAVQVFLNVAGVLVIGIGFLLVRRRAKAALARVA
jgi:uncharacterized membrane protein YdjX (TVP38/TMEM64 family)